MTHKLPEVGFKFKALVEFEVTDTDDGDAFPIYLSSPQFKDSIWVTFDQFLDLIESIDLKAKRKRLQAQLEDIQKQLEELK